MSAMSHFAAMQSGNPNQQQQQQFAATCGYPDGASVASHEQPMEMLESSAQQIGGAFQAGACQQQQQQQQQHLQPQYPPASHQHSGAHQHHNTLCQLQQECGAHQQQQVAVAAASTCSHQRHHQHHHRQAPYASKSLFHLQPASQNLVHKQQHHAFGGHFQVHKQQQQQPAHLVSVNYAVEQQSQHRQQPQVTTPSGCQCGQQQQQQRALILGDVNENLAMTNYSMQQQQQPQMFEYQQQHSAGESDSDSNCVSPLASGCCHHHHQQQKQQAAMLRPRVSSFSATGATLRPPLATTPTRYSPPAGPLTTRSMSFSGGGAVRPPAGTNYSAACPETQPATIGQQRQVFVNTTNEQQQQPFVQVRSPQSGYWSGSSHSVGSPGSPHQQTLWLSSGAGGGSSSPATSSPGVPANGCSGISESALQVGPLGINLEQYISKRNERERSRVRNVNDAFENLKSSLPLDLDKLTKRISKVEILRTAINYIRDLETVLSQQQQQQQQQQRQQTGVHQHNNSKVNLEQQQKQQDLEIKHEGEQQLVTVGANKGQLAALEQLNAANHERLVSQWRAAGSAKPADAAGKQHLLQQDCENSEPIASSLESCRRFSSAAGPAGHAQAAFSEPLERHQLTELFQRQQQQQQRAFFDSNNNDCDSATAVRNDGDDGDGTKQQIVADFGDSSQALENCHEGGFSQGGQMAQARVYQSC